MLGEVADAIAIGAIVVLNAVIGFVQEYRAERAVLALRSMTAPRARVLRDGRSVVIAASAVVPGDVLVLEAGDVVAADARLLEAHALSTNEAALTGESVPVEKSTHADRPRTRRWPSGTTACSWARRSRPGRGAAEVVATGMRTELGTIAHLLGPRRGQRDAAAAAARARRADAARTVPRASSASWSRWPAALRGWPPLQVFMAAVSLAVAAVPEGLPAIVTDRARDRRPAHGGAPRARPPAAGGRDARLRHRDLHRQDRHADDRA